MAGLGIIVDWGPVSAVICAFEYGCIGSVSGGVDACIEVGIGVLGH